ncbi:MAG: hypothetical protein JXA93_16930 [Anaerolineae bacterium]|nr:hypothetical protein [Anaerolineae bacterium]
MMGKATLLRVTFGLFLLFALLAPLTPGATSASVAAPAQPPDAYSPWACTPPVIDGSAPFHEWGAAPSLDTAHGQIRFMNDGDYLYFLFDVVGDTVDDPPLGDPPWGDFFWLTFDVNLDALITPQLDLNYNLFPSLPYQLGMQHYLGPATFTPLGPSTALLGVGIGPTFASPVPHRTWELAIPLDEIRAGPGAYVSAGFRLYSENPPFDDQLPPHFDVDFSDLIVIALSETGCQVGIEKSVSASIADPGDILNYRIDYFLPAGVVYQDLTIYDALPPDLIYLPGSASPPAIFSGGVLTWKLGDVSTSGSVEFQAMVAHDVCRRQGVVEDIASLSASLPYVVQISNPAVTDIICRPVEFPTDDPPYAESEITVRPYPLVVGQPTMLCTTIVNTSAQMQTVEVVFELANFGIGLPFTPIVAPGNPRVVDIPPHGSVTVCIQWVPATPGHQCVQVVVSDVNQQFELIRSQRNLDVSEVLVPGEPSAFEFPVGNNLPDPVDVQMVVRNNCPGWMVSVNPNTFSLAPDTEQVVTVEVTPPPGFVLGSGCTIDIEAWVVDAAGNLVRLLGGIRKIDEPLIPLGPPGERPFAEKEIRVNPYPVVAGEVAEVCVLLENNTGVDQAVTVEFMMSNFGIGLPFTTIPTTGAPNPQTVILPAYSTVVVCIQFLPPASGHHCLAVKLSMPNGYETISRRNLDVAELLEPEVPEEVPIAVANPTAAMADIDLVVDNTCLGWTAWVSPTVLYAVGPDGTDVRTVVLTVIPPPGLLGTDCHIDLLAYINGRLIGGVRKIDRPPTAPPIDEPPWAEREITVTPDPPVAGQPAQVCVELVNPTPVDQVVDVTFAEADFGAGIWFTNFANVAGSVIPANGKLIICVPWTPAAGGTLHRCLRVQIHQDGYHDIFTQRNVDLVRFPLGVIQVPGGQFDLPPFVLKNPGPDPMPFFFHLVPVGLAGMHFQVMEVATRSLVEPADEVWLAGGEAREFFVRIEAAGDPGLIGAETHLDVLPYGNGQPVTLDGVQSGVRYLLELLRIYLPLVVRNISTP